MADPYIGEIRSFGFTFPPYGWATCNGSQMAVGQNPALYAIIGIRFGGTLNKTFNLPNLQARVPMGSGTGPGLTPRSVASQVGTTTVTLSDSNMPAHNHNVVIESAGVRAGLVTGANPTSQYLASASFGSAAPTKPEYLYSPQATNTIPLAANTLSSFGGQASSGSAGGHENRQPALVINFCIALDGLFPINPS
ncbi:MAG: tail fiber protein [Magnetococcales bacterium]|nr:tail fiber protein [Magnetococcales bacterium]